MPYLLISSRFASFRIDLSGFRYLGLIPILIGVMIYIWCAWNFTFIGKGTPAPFDPPKELVVKGPYQYARNPMYVFLVLALTGEAIFFETTILILFAAAAVIFVHLWVVLYEDGLETKVWRVIRKVLRKSVALVPWVTASELNKTRIIAEFVCVSV